MRALGAYIFAGGFSLGVSQAGFEVVDHVESSDFGVETARLNLGVPVSTQWSAVPRGLDLIFANPPCAAWSMAGRRADWRQDRRATCARQAFGLLAKARPRALMWESVARVDRDMLREMAGEALDMGYCVSLVLHDGRHLGLPQRRRRMMFVACERQVAWQRQPPAQGARTVREAWRGLAGPGLDVPRLSDGWRRLLESGCRPGEKLYLAYDRRHQMLRQEPPRDSWGRRVGRPGFLHARLAWDAPSPTCTGGHHLYHPDETRGVSLLEMQLLCGYPASYEFAGKRRWAQVAQAVLPPVGFWFARAVREALERGTVPVGRPVLEEVDLCASTMSSAAPSACGSTSRAFAKS